MTASAPVNPAPVLVTGCSSGIGLATALAIARAGWPVLAGVKSAGEVGELPKALAAEPLPIETVVIDIASEASVAEAFVKIRARHDRLRLLARQAIRP